MDGAGGATEEVATGHILTRAGIRVANEIVRRGAVRGFAIVRATELHLSSSSFRIAQEEKIREIAINRSRKSGDGGREVGGGGERSAALGYK